MANVYLSGKIRSEAINFVLSKVNRAYSSTGRLVQGEPKVYTPKQSQIT